jgi:hypothetical protein
MLHVFMQDVKTSGGEQVIWVTAGTVVVAIVDTTVVAIVVSSVVRLDVTVKSMH